MTRPVPDLRMLEGPIHFMGIGGAGMCALAEMMLREGKEVTGCDLKESDAILRLVRLGAEIREGHDPSHVEGIAALVRTSAIPWDHPELQAARAAGVPVWKRAQALGAVVNTGRVIAVAGTHGKTSTTALTVSVLAEAGLDPTGFVGGSVPAWGGNLRLGGELYVVEADEYDRSFHTLQPDVAIVTNLEADHLDIYGDLAGVREAFHEFLRGRRPGSKVVVCADDPGASSLLPAVNGSGYTYGLSAGSQLRAVDVAPEADGTAFRVIEDGHDRGSGWLPMPGLHNLRNALAAAATARHYGVDWSAIRRGWSTFTGVGRRFQRLGEVNGIILLDDYAHHPTEVAATLEGARHAFPGRRIVALFQPHLYTRTRDFTDDFGRALALADELWVTGIFPAREAPIPGVDGSIIADAARRAGAQVHYHADLDTLAEAVAPTLAGGDVAVTMGAGSIERVGPRLLERLKEVAHAR